ncbi:transglycosylase domain-containing protein [Actinomycetospora sp. NBC_00405]|uniref:transglycosylase domain-containing protein n=1 Tax=Actinomycetospora sp. NBC_00405 TaxID=2975952 RepID=UPI002E250106
MAGTHSRPSGRRHAVDPDEAADEGERSTPGATGGRRARREDRERLDRERDSDYGDYVRERLRSEPAPSSPPVGFPSALSTGSFRPGRATTGTTPAPAAPSRPAAPAGGAPRSATATEARPAAAPTAARPAAPAGPAPTGRPVPPTPVSPAPVPPAPIPTVPPPPAAPAPAAPPKPAGPPPTPAGPPPGPPARPGPVRPGPGRSTPPPGPAQPAGTRGRPAAPASRPPRAPDGRPGAAPGGRAPAGPPPVGPSRGPVRGGPAPAGRPSAPPPGRPPGGAPPPTNGTAPPSTPATPPATGTTAATPSAPATSSTTAAPTRNRPGGTAAMPAIDAPSPRGPGSGPLPRGRGGRRDDEPAPVDDDLEDLPETPDDDQPDEAADAGTTRAARPTRTGAGHTTRRATSRSRTSGRTANRSTGRSTRAGESDAPRVPRGRIALAIAAVLSVVAARVVRLPHGDKVVAFGRRVRSRVVLYLDGPHPETIAPAALRWRRIRRSLYAGVAAMIAAPVFSLLVGWLFIPVPNADDAVESQLNTVSFSDGTVLARIAPGEQGNRQKVGLEQVPPPVRFAVLSAEDRTFYSNSGFDVTGFGRAVWKNLTGGSGGGSTITQQYVKNAMVGDEYSLMRKYKELIISLKISQERSKDEILGDYLNSIYFGRGAYGIQAASQAYFGRPVETLTPAEGALLAGVIQAPSKWDPAQNPDDALRRWNYVMDGMVAQSWLPAPERAAAQFPVTVPPRRVTGGVPDDDRGHIYSAVRDELRTLGIDQDALVTEGLQIQTTITPEAQREAVEAVRSKMGGQPDNLRTSTVSIDPETGGILAYYGGDNGSGLDYARVEKQAGSTFKPFVLLAALQQDPPIGISTEFDGRSIPGQTVRNVDGADCANCSLKRAMTLSNNVVFTALGNRVGPQAVAAAARQAGISQPMNDPDSGISLGNQETTAVDLASAYATFSNEGMYHRPHLVQRVTTASGEVLYDQSTTPGEQRIDPRVARNVTEAMRDVPDYDGVGLEGGRQAAAKTGTVQSHVESQNNDAWFAGYTPNASTVVWVGTDDNTPIRTADGRPVYGHGLPSEIWKTFMDDALEDAPRQTFGTFTPVAGTDPGDTADSAEGPAESTPSSTSSPSSTSAPTSTTAPPDTDVAQPAEEVPPAVGDPAAAEDPAAAGDAPVEGAEGEGGADPPAN